ncbi:MAG: alpha/beta fold hydrolase [Alphaproteobacteria bacterium]|nr:alpha/beta fold hydrolase [Alphaproteobacteria bacterium]
MMDYTEEYILSQNSHGEHKVFYSDWGVDNTDIIVCVHGLTGNGSDADYLAPALVENGYRVIAVDLPGRGRSDFLADPMDYNYDQYRKDLLALLNHLDVSQVDWLGISLGGLLGIWLAGEENSPIKRLIINDVGPDVPKNALDFIHTVISQEYRFENVQALEKRMRETRGLTWGSMSDEQWAHMAKSNARELEDGQITYAYDPNISKIFETAPIGDVDLWPHWENIDIPTFLIHGKKSVVLPKAIIDRMRQKGPEFDYIAFADCGHVPSLWAPEQVDAITAWLNKTK